VRIAMALFQRGFMKYFNSGRYSDLTIVSQSVQYKVHKMVLAYSSEFFARLLLGEFREKSEKIIELKYPDPDGLFPEVLKFMYSGELDLNSENSISIFAMADHYLIKRLK
jgi:hypothetical protein